MFWGLDIYKVLDEHIGNVKKKKKNEERMPNFIFSQDMHMNRREQVTFILIYLQQITSFGHLL